MDERRKFLCKELAKMNSSEAADWLISTYPIDSHDCGEAILLMPHRSWKKPDQKKLANYYLQNIPFSSKYGYESFLSFMSVRSFISAIMNFIPKDDSKKNLLRYYLIPSLNRAAKNDIDRQLIDDFIKEVWGQSVTG